MPKSTIVHGAAELLVARDRVDEPVGPDLARVVVADRHAGLQPRADDAHLAVEVALAHRGPLRPQLRAPSRRRSRRRASRGACRAARAGCAAPRRARRRSTRARWRSASAGRALRRGRCPGGSACCRRRRRGAWSRHIRLAPPWPRPSTPSPPRIRARAWSGRSSSRGSSTAASTCRRSRTRRSRRRCSGAAPCPGSCSTAAKILGSLHIMRALDEQVPEPPLCPADPKERKSVELAEGWGDEVLQPLVRRVIWSALRRAPAAMPSYSEGSGSRSRRRVARLSAPLIARAEQRINDASDLNVRADLAHLDNHLARVDRLDRARGDRRRAAERRRPPDRRGPAAAADDRRRRALRRGRGRRRSWRSSGSRGIRGAWPVACCRPPGCVANVNGGWVGGGSGVAAGCGHLGHTLVTTAPRAAAAPRTSLPSRSS